MKNGSAIIITTSCSAWMPLSSAFRSHACKSATSCSTETLVREGFKPMVYCVDDPIAAKRLEDAGAVARLQPGVIGRIRACAQADAAAEAKAGETVLLSLFGADSDPARGDRPSLMFGRGAHYCLGAQAADAIVDAVAHATGAYDIPAWCDIVTTDG